MKKPLVIHQAGWVVTMAGPVFKNGAVVVAGDRIIAVGPAATVKNTRQYQDHDPDEIIWYDHGDGAIIPALVNGHLHLEFTALRQAIGPQTNLPAWLTAAIAAFSRLAPSEIERGVEDSIAELRRFGTILGAEVSNTGFSLPLLVKNKLEFHYFYECLGFNLLNELPLTDDFPFLGQDQISWLPVSAAAHASYSASPSLFRRIKQWNHQQKRLTGIHLAESRDEIIFLKQGNGFLQELLVQRGRWLSDFVPPGCSPTVYLDRLDFWNEQTLAVHGVWLDSQDRDLLARQRVWLCLCPRSNRHTGAGFPDLPALISAGVRLILGTDSLASCPDFNLFQEMQILRDHFPEVQISELLTMATINGATALRRNHDLGSLDPGKKAALLFVPISPETPLWSGLLEAGGQGRIFWLTANGKELNDGA